MSGATDRELLSRYVREADHDAFAELVRRYIAFVHATALRQTRDSALADDVTQAVMIVLARKAGRIASDAVLASWLFTVTRHAAQNAMKMQSRRVFHERRAAARRAEQMEAPQYDSLLRDVLDEAIARLPQLERSGVLLHYFHDRSHEQIGLALGLSTDAARKRVSRALDKMHIFLNGRGVALSSVALVTGIRAEMGAASVPAGLIDSSINVALLSGSAAAQSGSGALAIAQGVTHTFAVAKLKVAATIALTVAGVAGAAAYPLAGIAGRVFTSTTTTLVSQPAQPATQRAQTGFVAEVSKQVKIEFLAVSDYPGDENSWFTIAGEPTEIPDPKLLQQQVRAEPPPEHQLVMRIHRPRGTVITLHVEGAMMASNSHTDADAANQYLLTSCFKLQAPADTLSVRLGIASAEWKTIAASDDAQQLAEVDAGEYGMMTFLPPDKDDLMGRTKVEVHHDVLRVPNQLVVTDDQGKEHTSHNVNVSNTNDQAVSSHSFDLPIEKIAKVRLEVREYDKIVEADDISLSPEKRTIPRITVKDAK